MAAQLWNNPLVYVLALTLVTALFRAGIWVGGVNEHKRVVSGFMAEIREDIKKLLRRSGSAAVTSDSPLMLTELGDAIATELDATSWAHQAAECIRDEVEGKRPYEIPRALSRIPRLRRVSAIRRVHGRHQDLCLRSRSRRGSGSVRVGDRTPG